MDTSASKKLGKGKKTKAVKEEIRRTVELQEKLAVQDHKNKELEDRLLRLAAEFDNYKKRTAKEFDQLVKTANENLIHQLVDVLDNFERALDSAKTAQDFDSFHRGVEFIYQHIQEILIREGLEPIEAVGQPFDPYRHEAMMLVEDGKHPPETVVSEMQRGYMLGDKLLRAARVVVSRKPDGDATEEPSEHEKVEETE